MRMNSKKEATNSTFYYSTTLKKAPHIDVVFFSRIKDKVLGKNYELDLRFIGKKRAQTLNRTHRQKDYATDILSFPISDANGEHGMGEIYIHPDKARIKAKEFGRTFDNYLKFVFIHGLMHLKGFDHGSRMESEEAKIRRFFQV